MASDQTALSPDDRDAAIRTVLTEAANDPTAWASVASTIANRQTAGKYGKTVKDIVTAPNAFEVWTNGRAQNVSQNDPNYDAAGRIVDATFGNSIPDPTNGATHFYAPKAQASLGRNAPSWAANQPLANVGGQLFYAPDSPPIVRKQAPASAAINAATTATAPQMATAKTSTPIATPDEEAILSGFSLGDDKTPATSAAPVAQTPDEKDALSGFDIGGDDASKAPSDVNNAPTAKSDPIYHGAVPIGTAPDQGSTTAFTGSAVSGVPIVGPSIDTGLKKVAAAARAISNNTKYSDELNNVQEMSDVANQQHPIAALAGDVTGKALGYGQAAAIAPGAIGGVGNTLASRALTAIPANALIGGGDAAVRSGGNLKDTAIGAGLGGIGGAAGPVAGAVGGKIGNAIAGGLSELMPTAIPGVSRAAGNILSKITTADDPAAIQNVLQQHGPLTMLADAGPSTQAITGALVGEPSAAKSTVMNALKLRAQGSNARLNTDINAAVGPAPVPSHVENSISAAQEALQPQYTQALSGARAVDTTALANDLDSRLANLRGGARTAVSQARDFLNIPGTNELDPNPQALLATRQALDGMLSKEIDPNTIRNLTTARQQVDAALTEAVPGIKTVDAQYQDLARQHTALQEGSQILDAGKTAVHPTDLAQSFPDSATPASNQLIGPSGVPLRTQQGARAEIDRLVGTKSNDLGAVKNLLQGEGGWNTAKLNTIFGEQPTNRLIGAVDRESTFANTNNRIAENSQTFQREAAKKLLDQTAPASTNLGSMTALGLGLQGGKALVVNPIIKMVMENPTAPRNLELARVLTAQGPERDAFFNGLQNYSGRKNLLTAAGDRLSKAGESAIANIIRSNAPRLQNRLNKQN